ncbi:MAG: hypothetical protein H0W07_02015 [Chloroflexi bacterium]|nr:hypothetical protein [Chloroflexota bacterium]
MFRPSPFLRRVLIVDALASGATALLLIVAADLLHSLLAVPGTLSRAAGLLLVPYVAVVAILALRARFPAIAVWAVIAANLLWTAASALVLASGAIAPNLLGYAVVLAQAIVVGVLGALQYVAMRAQPAAPGRTAS